MMEAFEPGTFFTGCNYWASHAGMMMWRDWRENQVIEDLDRLKAHGITYLRIFPLWNDFQPLTLQRAIAASPREVRMYEQPLPDTRAGADGMDEEMLLRFECFLNLAHERGIRVIVALLTGWMSGRLFAPPMLEHVNLLCDPTALRWEVRFVRHMVHRFKNHPALLAWDLGNECNCMGVIDCPDQLYTWIALISSVIRAEDSQHLVISGMHGLRPGENNNPKDQGELLDVLCTHPYPLFTQHCDTDPMTGIKSQLHAVAESRMTADLSGKPCFAEELGVLGPMIVSEKGAEEYLRGALLGLWRYDCRGLLWWCAFDQKHLACAPYDWTAIERELGLFDGDRAKPCAEALREFTQFLHDCPIQSVPNHICDAVCILSRMQDCWATAYGAFMLGCQAKLDMHFAWSEDALPDADVYLLPCITGDQSIPGRRWNALLERVKDGATLYISMNDGILSSFAEVTGLEVQAREHSSQTLTAKLREQKISLPVEYHLLLKPQGAEVLLETLQGEPLLSRHTYGKGTVWFLNAPLECLAATVPGIMDGPHSLPLYQFYRLMALRSPKKHFDCNDPFIGMSEHLSPDGRRLVLVQNYSSQQRLLNLDSKPLACYSPGNRMHVLENKVVCLPSYSGGVLVFDA